MAVAKVSSDVNVLSSPQIAKLGDLTEIDPAIYPQVFVASLGIIYQYSTHDIRNMLDNVESEILVATSIILCTEVINIFPRYKENVSLKATPSTD